MSDVAKMCGVSATTVSYVLGGRHKEMRIPKSTCERVLAFCEAVNYRPNHLASSLAKGRTGTIGVVYPNARGDFMNDSLWGIREVLSRENYQTAVALSSDDPEIESRHLDFFRHRLVDAIIAFPVWSDFGFGHWGARDLSPVVFIDMAPPISGVSCVGIDDVLAGRQSAAKAAECGAQGSILMEPRSVAPTVLRRVTGFRDGAREAGLPVETVVAADDGAALCRALHSLAGKRLAIFTPVAGTIIPSLATAMRQQILSPEHTIVSVGEAPESVFLPNVWWMLRQDAVKMGHEAAAMILKMIDAPSEEGLRIDVPCSWVRNHELFTP